MSLKDIENTVTATAQNIITHPSYNYSVSDDVGLIQLRKSIVTGQYVSIIPLSGSTISDNISVTVSGFGRISDNSRKSQNLMYVSLTTITNAQCRETFTFVSPAIVCCIGVNRRNTCHVSKNNYHYNNYCH